MPSKGHSRAVHTEVPIGARKRCQNKRNRQLQLLPILLLLLLFLFLSFHSPLSPIVDMKLNTFPEASIDCTCRALESEGKHRRTACIQTSRRERPPYCDTLRSHLTEKEVNMLPCEKDRGEEGEGGGKGGGVPHPFLLSSSLYFVLP